MEFDTWRWADLGEALDHVAAFKREAYRRVVEAFAPLAAGLAHAASAPARNGLDHHGRGRSERREERLGVLQCCRAARTLD